MRIDELREALREEAEDLAGTEPLTPRARADRVVRQVQSTGARRRGSFGLALAVAVVAAVAAVVVIPPLLPDPPPAATINDPMVEAPPRLAGYVMPLKVTVDKVTYQYVRGQEVDQERERLQMPVAASPSRQVLGWSTSPETPGEVVVSVDGEVVSRGAAGRFEYGVVLTPGVTHLITVRATRPVHGRGIGAAVYGPEHF